MSIFISSLNFFSGIRKHTISCSFMSLIILNIYPVLIQTVERWWERTVLLVGWTLQSNTGRGRLVFSGTTSMFVEEHYCPSAGSYQLLTVSKGKSFTNARCVLEQNFSQKHFLFHSVFLLNISVY